MKNIDEKIFNALINKDINLATEALTMPNTDSVTNSVRKKLNSLNPKQILEIQDFLYLLLNSCYQNKLFYSNTSLASLTLEADKLFLLKENIIYYLGRLSVPPDVQILKSAYDLDLDLHIKLNITFSSLITFDETMKKILYQNLSQAIIMIYYYVHGLWLFLQTLIILMYIRI